jgi:Lrp/AsnC family transcriptional regulator, leucine-responsive regulatory protein
MNHSRYLTRRFDHVDRAIIAALSEDGRMTIREIAAHIGLSSPSITERILKLKDAGAIKGYSVVVDPKAFGLSVTAHIRLGALPGEAKRVEQMLMDAPEIVEADRVSGGDCFIAKVIVRSIEELHSFVERFHKFASADTSVVLSQVATRRLPRF